MLAQTSAPATQPSSDSDLGPLLMVLVPAGILLGIVWLFRRIAYPRKVTLTRTPGRPNTLHPVVLVVLLGLLLLLWDASGWLWSNWFTGPPKSPGHYQQLVLTANTVQVLFLAICLAVAAVTFRHGLARGFGLTVRHWRYDLLRGVIAMLIALPICIGLKLATFAMIRWIYASDPQQIEQLTRAPGLMEALKALADLPAADAWRIAVVTAAVVLAPLSEEVFFRGLVQSSLRQVTGRPWVAIIVASGLFAYMHVEWVNRPALLALGLVLGYNYERTGRLMPAIVIHSLFNATFIANQLFQGE
ncbi:hypothetical protein LCGC14_0094460 [marine sediment metagenome]|uniref:CAAX prenyl protease 2/Lysostaphin resistance protein A-like domain-containing protein n=1 Tax=marine sediment metagenome TaxID=412755 RepID=A0A0F9VED9_9ZZZZ